jgi:hypothetical protein
MKNLGVFALEDVGGSALRHAKTSLQLLFAVTLPPITYYWTGLLILDHSYLVENLTNSKIAETKALKPLKS